MPIDTKNTAMICQILTIGLPSPRRSLYASKDVGAMNDRRHKLFCFGLGYSAQALIRRLPEGWSVAGTCRSNDAVEKMRARGIDAYRFDSKDPDDAVNAGLSDADHILTSIAPDDDGDPVLRHFTLPATARWVGYLSTTAVYGNRDGGWVDEETPTAPSSARGRRRVGAEQEWLAQPRAAHIFRLAGIYGLGRSTFERLRAGTANRIVKPGQMFSRIHVDDIANVLLASFGRPSPGRVYNVCDDEPAPPQDVVVYAADLLGIEPPPAVGFDSADLSPMARSFYSENRRVRNERIKGELGVRLAYPTYREGLAAIRAEMIGH
jgi:nucleoside-diphosphate-sugar epimerase